MATASTSDIPSESGNKSSDDGIPKVRLQSSDGEMFEIPVEVATRADTIKQLIHDLGIGAGDSKLADGGEGEYIPLPEIKGATLKRIIDYAEFHKNDSIPSPEEEEYASYRTDDIAPWDQEFLKVDQATLFEILTAANYLGLRPLLDTCCKVVANTIKGKSVEEVRATFNIENDFTPQEEEAIRKENEWCEERD